MITCDKDHVPPFYIQPPKMKGRIPRRKSKESHNIPPLRLQPRRKKMRVKNQYGAMPAVAEKHKTQ
jgi:hypothetical protein